MSSPLTHFDPAGQAHMVDVGSKPESARVAVAEGCIRMQPATFALVESGGHKKGDVLGIARVAAIMGAKQTPALIPLCHPIALTRVAVTFDLDRQASSVRCQVTAETVGKTGVEMEALTGASVALLTVYDMCKAIDKRMTLGEIHLVEKHGGKSGDWVLKK